MGVKNANLVRRMLPTPSLAVTSSLNPENYIKLNPDELLKRSRHG